MSKINKLFLFLSGSYFGILVYSAIEMIGKQYNVVYGSTDVLKFLVWVLSIITVGYFTILIFKK